MLDTIDSKKASPLRRIPALKPLPGDFPVNLSTMFSETQAHTNTRRLIADLRSSRARSIVPQLPAQFAPGSYRVVVEQEKSLPKFILHSWERGLEKFLGPTNIGSDILRFSWAGLQYHWRSDLAKSLEGGKPFLGRIQVSSVDHSINIDHLTLPVFEKGKTINIYGWFICDRSLETARSLNFRWSEDTIVRRPQRSQPIKLPARLSNSLSFVALNRRIFKFASRLFET